MRNGKFCHSWSYKLKCSVMNGSCHLRLNAPICASEIQHGNEVGYIFFSMVHPVRWVCYYLPSNSIHSSTSLNELLGSRPLGKVTEVQKWFLRDYVTWDYVGVFAKVNRVGAIHLKRATECVGWRYSMCTCVYISEHLYMQPNNSSECC